LIDNCVLLRLLCDNYFVHKSLYTFEPDALF